MRISNMRIYAPLKQGHPLIGLLGGCALCHEGFAEGQRTTLAPARMPLMRTEKVPAIPLHATCALEGMHVLGGTIARIKDGDGSPFPVLLVTGEQKTFAEVGLDGE